jgi:hypothetical protein
MKPTIVENLQAMIDAVQAHPDDQLYLAAWHTCGSIYCIGGLCAVTPHFTAQGVKPAISGAPALPNLSFTTTLNRLFGTYLDSDGEEEAAYWFIFTPHGDSEWDRGLDPHDALTDKDLALARLRKALAIQQELAQ